MARPNENEYGLGAVHGLYTAYDSWIVMTHILTRAGSSYVGTRNFCSLSCSNHHLSLQNNTQASRHEQPPESLTKDANIETQAPTPSTTLKQGLRDNGNNKTSKIF
jgi:hypothetical protein